MIQNSRQKYDLMLDPEFPVEVALIKTLSDSIRRTTAIANRQISMSQARVSTAEIIQKLFECALKSATKTYNLRMPAHRKTLRIVAWNANSRMFEKKREINNRLLKKMWILAYLVKH